MDKQSSLMDIDESIEQLREKKRFYVRKIEDLQIRLIQKTNPDVNVRGLTDLGFLFASPLTYIASNKVET